MGLSYTIKNYHLVWALWHGDFLTTHMGVPVQIPGLPFLSAFFFPMKCESQQVMDGSSTWVSSTLVQTQMEFQPLSFFPLSKKMKIINTEKKKKNCPDPSVRIELSFVVKPELNTYLIRVCCLPYGSVNMNNAELLLGAFRWRTW